jgi:hypothetical protein
MPRLVSLLSMLALTLIVLSARAAPKHAVQVLILQSEDAVPQAQALTAALKTAVDRVRGHTLAEGDYSFEVLSLAMGCDDPPDAECLTRIGVKIGASRYVWGTMVREGGKVVATLHLWRRGGTMTDIRVRYSSALLDPEDDALRELAAKAFLELTKESSSLGVDDEVAGHPAPAPARAAKSSGESEAWQESKGKLVISAGGVDGEVVIDGRPAGPIRDGHAEFDVPIGEHYVVVRAPGYREAVGTVMVTGRKRARLTLYPEQRGSVRQALNWNEEESSSNSGAGWGAIGVGALMTAAGVYSTVKLRSINDGPELSGYRSAFRADQNVCLEADKGTAVPGQASPSRIKDLCSQARTFEALQYVFFGLGAVATGTGVLILLTDDSGEQKSASALKISPEVGRRQGGVRLEMLF